MDLIINRQEGNKVFTFDESLGPQVWESDPITRFRFKIPVDNDWLKKQLTANHPTAGIVFDGIPYIGTNDGLIYTPDKKIQRIPEVMVDTEVFIDEYSFVDDSERQAFEMFKKKGFESLDLKNKSLVQRVFEIDKTFHIIAQQEHNLERYLRGYLAIRGFVIDKNYKNESEILYDGHLLGITETNSGRTINELAPQALYQLNPSKAGFVPIGFPPIALTKATIEDGIEKHIEVFCVDYHSLWDLTGQGRFVKEICPRDGSGYAPAKFATDGETIVISHGNHPYYKLEISKKTRNGIQEKVKSIDLDPNKLPKKLLVENGMVFGDYGNTIRNFLIEEDVFSPKDGQISSIADSGLCTVENDGKTFVYNPFNSKKLDSLKGDYVFLSRTPQ